MDVVNETLAVATTADMNAVDLTPQLEHLLAEIGLRQGQVVVFVPGSTGAVTTIEFESGAIEDLKAAIDRLAPRSISYAHDARWGDGNGYSHVRAALLGPSLSVPISDGCLSLGTWQQVVLLDFDNRPRTRRVLVQLIGQKHRETA